MGIQKVSMMANAFFGDNEIEIAFPETWTVEECRMKGHGKAPLTEDEIRNALN